MVLQCLIVYYHLIIIVLTYGVYILIWWYRLMILLQLRYYKWTTQLNNTCTIPDFIKFTYYDETYTFNKSTVLLSTMLYCNHSNVWIVCGVILYSTFEVQCTSLSQYTIVNVSTVIVCKLMLGTVHIIMYVHFWACREIPTIIVFHSGNVIIHV